jgi:ribonuclease E
MTKRMLVDATHAEETRVAVVDGTRLTEYDYESQVRRQLKGSIFLAKVTRVEPSLQAAFINFGGNRHAFLPFSEIHPDYFRIPVADREALIAEQRAEMEARLAEEEAEEQAEAAAAALRSDNNLAADAAYTEEGAIIDYSSDADFQAAQKSNARIKGLGAAGDDELDEDLEEDDDVILEIGGIEPIIDENDDEAFALENAEQGAEVDFAVVSGDSYYEALDAEQEKAEASSAVSVEAEEQVDGAELSDTSDKDDSTIIIPAAAAAAPTLVENSDEDASSLDDFSMDLVFEGPEGVLPEGALVDGSIEDAQIIDTEVKTALHGFDAERKLEPVSILVNDDESALSDGHLNEDDAAALEAEIDAALVELKSAIIETSSDDYSDEALVTPAYDDDGALITPVAVIKLDENGQPLPVTEGEDEAGGGEGRSRFRRHRGRGRGRGRNGQSRPNGHNSNSARRAAGDSRVVEVIGGDNVEGDHVARPSLRKNYKIQEVIKRGQIMLIQVSKEERGNKGAAVTTYLSLPGRYCVLMPNSPRGGGVSRKIASVQDRRRMRELLSDLDVPEGMSVIMRTAGVSRTKAEIKRDLDYLLRLWDNIRDLTLQSSAPSLVHEEGNLIRRSIRDIYSRDIDEVVVAGEEGFKNARDFMKMMIPSHGKRVVHYTDKMPLFSRYQVEHQITQMAEPIVTLKSGGYLVINQTEALVSVDVNSGRATKERHIEETALKTNLEAADEVARQLRLRDLGGLVVVDFIDMEDRRNNRKVEQRFRDALSTDRARIQIGRISSFGLLELSRQRLNPSLNEAQFEKCPHCKGNGTIRTVDSAAILVLRAIQEEAARSNVAELHLHIASPVAIYILNHKREMLAEIEAMYGIKILVRIDEECAPAGYRIDAVRAVAQFNDDEDDEQPARDNRRERSKNDRQQNDRQSNERQQNARNNNAQHNHQHVEADGEGDAELVDNAAQKAQRQDRGEQARDDEQGEGLDGRRRRGRRGGRRRGRGRNRENLEQGSAVSVEGHNDNHMDDAEPNFNVRLPDEDEAPEVNGNYEGAHELSRDLGLTEGQRQKNGDRQRGGRNRNRNNRNRRDVNNAGQESVVRVNDGVSAVSISVGNEEASINVSTVSEDKASQRDGRRHRNNRRDRNQQKDRKDHNDNGNVAAPALDAAPVAPIGNENVSDDNAGKKPARRRNQSRTPRSEASKDGAAVAVASAEASTKSVTAAAKDANISAAPAKPVEKNYEQVNVEPVQKKRGWWNKLVE